MIYLLLLLIYAFHLKAWNINNVNYLSTTLEPPIVIRFLYLLHLQLQFITQTVEQFAIILLLLLLQLYNSVKYS